MSLADQFEEFVTGENTCIIWGTECQGKRQDTATITVLNSPRAGGGYVIDRNVISELGQMYAKLDASESDDGYVDTFRARLTTLLVREQQLGNDLPKITASTTDVARSAGPARIEERLTSLLRFLVDSTPSIGLPVDIVYPDESGYMEDDQEYEEAKRNVAFALAHSESTNVEEMEYLMDSLATRGLIDKGTRIRTGHSTHISSGFGFLCRVTDAGYSQIESLQAERTSDQCFVALWFNDKTDALYDNAIEPAVKAAGL